MSQTESNGGTTSYLEAAEDLRSNTGQWAAYESTGSCVVLAGPGSGKTKTLTTKLARMLAEDVQAPRGLACITFNNACVRELRRRLSELGIEQDRRISIGTLHSFCLQHVVTPYAKLGGVPAPEPLNVALTTERDECWALAVEAVLGLDENPRSWEFRCTVYRRTHLDRKDTSWYADDEDAAKVVEAYEHELLNKGLIDFDGMILAGLRLVEEHEWVRRALLARFPILVVDEYQDLGRPLHRIVEALRTKAGIRLFAVGDPDQSIYGFTGAEPGLLQELVEADEITVARLKLNYRCGPTIIRASEAALGEGRGYESKGEELGTIDIHHRPAGLADQASFVVDQLIPRALAGESREPGDVAVLYRDRFDGDEIASAVEQQGWEFIRIDQGNPYPRSPLIYWLEDCAAWCAGGWMSGYPRLTHLIWTWLGLNASSTSDEQRRALRNPLVRFLQGHRDPALNLHEWLVEFYADCLEGAIGREPTLRDEGESFQKLLAACAPGARLAAFTVAAFGGQGGAPSHLNLMTLHSAKGLEFDVVVMIGLEEGRLPHFASTVSAKLREDRRLFYVGLTRAREEVHLVYSGWYTNQYDRRFNNGASRFVREVEHALAEAGDP